MNISEIAEDYKVLKELPCVIRYFADFYLPEKSKEGYRELQPFRTSDLCATLPEARCHLLELMLQTVAMFPAGVSLHDCAVSAVVKLDTGISLREWITIEHNVINNKHYVEKVDVLCEDGTGYLVFGKRYVRKHIRYVND